ncbi:MAG: hypothetical protein IIU14_06980 [Ruminococcus sp.]|nr:hypothetical protein [Ruminococcus sp.]
MKCPNCRCIVPSNEKSCGYCGYVFRDDDVTVATDFPQYRQPRRRRDYDYGYYDYRDYYDRYEDYDFGYYPAACVNPRKVRKTFEIDNTTLLLVLVCMNLLLLLLFLGILLVLI